MFEVGSSNFRTVNRSMAASVRGKARRQKFSMAGKTGTCQKDYSNKDQLNYISSFSGYFPADNPKYSCIVVIHEPDKSVGYFGADV